MEKYKIAITETLVKVVEIEAGNIKEAVEKVKEKYDRNHINLTHCSDLQRTEFNSLITIDLNTENDTNEKGE